MISAGPIENFRKGWAILPVQRSWQKPHYWRRVELTNEYRSACGVTGWLATREELVARGWAHAHSVKPLAPGDFMVDRCRNCSRRVQIGVQASAKRAYRVPHGTSKRS